MNKNTFYLTLRLHVIKFYRLMKKKYSTDVRQTKTYLKILPGFFKRYTTFLNIDGSLIKSNQFTTQIIKGSVP